VTSLVKRIDAAAVKNQKSDLRTWVVFLSDQEGLDKKLKDFADKDNIKKTSLAIDNPAGPPSYRIAKDADVTVLLYSRKKVKENLAFKKGDLTEKQIDKIVADISKILPEKSEKGG
jgi:hypothetical protein